MIIVETIETLLHEKFLLYRDLEEWLRQERRMLLDRQLDTDVLWGFSGKKQDTVHKIEKVRGKILAVLTEASIDHEMTPENFSMSTVISLLPGGESRNMKSYQVSLMALKRDVMALARENKEFVNEKLDMVNGLMAIITGHAKSQTGYGQGFPGGSVRDTEGVNMFLHKEA
ncbi:MAG: flagellar protein FlgN [Thermodesulfobacteriota bacterium]|nr:flagellar protein FlgN [Thermodesulfobacteriota bacterium]